MTKRNGFVTFDCSAIQSLDATGTEEKTDETEEEAAYRLEMFADYLVMCIDEPSSKRKMFTETVSRN